jgi:hypothetical protein
MIEYKGQDNNNYYYSLYNFNINFNINVDFKDFLKKSKQKQKEFFYDNLEHELKKHIRKCIIKIDNYAESQDYRALIIFLHCLAMDNIKLKKHIRIGNYIEVSIPKINNVKNIEWYFYSELYLLKQLQNKI